MLSLAQGGCGIAGGVLATLLSKCVERPLRGSTPLDAYLASFFVSAADFAVLIPVATSWLSIAVFTDGR